MRLGWTRFWVSASAIALFLGSSILALKLSANEQGETQRHNELRLGALQPGKNTIEDAKRVHRRGREGENPTHDPLVWIVTSAGNNTELRFEADAQHVLRGITASHPSSVPLPRAKNDGAALPADEPFAVVPQGPMWRTGLGLRLGHTCAKAVSLYGKPDSRSPSTKDGQPLELLYYAFDWAGPDVPQVMQVVCTAEKDGQAGRVAQITLAASSL